MRRVGIRWYLPSRSEGDSVYRAGMADQAVGIGWCGSSSGRRRGNSFSVKRPDADIGFRSASGNEGVITREIEAGYAERV